ncbi:MAG: FAD-binding protein, partial [Candidatus Accumulibacter phosphatis]|nr:FAD-binding protein [Candidatus Accumulibacter phosphatis]
HWRFTMPEPTSSGVAGAAALEAAAGAATDGTLLSTIVVMPMTSPRTHREWAVGWVFNFIEKNRNTGIDDVAQVSLHWCELLDVTADQAHADAANAFCRIHPDDLP